MIEENLIKCNLERADGLKLYPLPHNCNYLVSSIPTHHKISSFGYVYIGLTPNELKSLRSGGTILTIDTYYPEIAFKSNISNDIFLKARTLIIECTFLDDVSIDEAYHTHISEILENQNLFTKENIILMHFSDR